MARTGSAVEALVRESLLERRGGQLARLRVTETSPLPLGLAIVGGVVRDIHAGSVVCWPLPKDGVLRPNGRTTTCLRAAVGDVSTVPLMCGPPSGWSSLPIDRLVLARLLGEVFCVIQAGRVVCRPRPMGALPLPRV